MSEPKPKSTSRIIVDEVSRFVTCLSLMLIIAYLGTRIIDDPVRQHNLRVFFSFVAVGSVIIMHAIRLLKGEHLESRLPDGQEMAGENNDHTVDGEKWPS